VTSRAIAVAVLVAVALGATAVPAAAAVFVGSSSGRIDVADGGGAAIRYGVSGGQFLLYASPAPTPSAGCTTTTDPNVVTCPMAGIALVNFALGAGSSLDRAVGDSGPATSVDVNVSGSGGDTINLEGARNTINVRNGRPDTVNCRSGGPNVTSFDPDVDTVGSECNSTTPAPTPAPAPMPTPTPTPTFGMVKVARTPRLSARRLEVRLSCPGVNACVGTLRVYVAGRRVAARGVSVGSFGARTVSVTLGRRNRARLRRGSTLKLTYAGARLFSGRARLDTR
jgi:hypothetical protein